MSPSLLIHKLKVYGMDKDFCTWVSSYLSGRIQAVWINHVYSNFLENDIGVPQGSNLGPLFFLIFFNDLPTVIKEDIDCYADDSTLGATSNEIGNIGIDLSMDCSSLSKWMIENSFKLNPEKTHFMVVGTDRKLQNNTDRAVVTMDGVTLQESRNSSEELLGIKIQCNLK